MSNFRYNETACEMEIKRSTDALESIEAELSKSHVLRDHASPEGQVQLNQEIDRLEQDRSHHQANIKKMQANLSGT